MRKGLTKFTLLAILSVIYTTVTMTSVLATPSDIKGELQALQEQLADLEERLDEVEKSDASDKIHFTGQLTSKVHYTQYTANRRDQKKLSNGSNDPSDDDYEKIDDNEEFKQLQFYLNMRTEIVDDFRFTGRMTMFKNWGEEIYKKSNGVFSSGEARDSVLRLSRAYVDYFFSDYFTFTFGRLPASDGPPQELLDDAPRNSTYPSVMYGAEMDGMILTGNLPKSWFGNSLLRMGYGEVSNTDTENNYRDNKVEPLRVEIFQLETDISSKFSKSLLILSYVKASGHEIFPSDMENTEDDLEAAYSSNYSYEASGKTGWYRTMMLHGQFENIANKGVDAYLTAVSTYSYSNGNRVHFSNSNDSAYDVCIGKFQSTDCNADTKAVGYSGYAINAGGSFRLSHEDRLSSKVGYEWHYGSKYYMGSVFYDDYGEYSLAFYNTRGTAHHLYWLQPLERNLSVRLGGYLMDLNYEGDFYETPTSRSRRLTDFYLNITSRF